MRTLTCTWGFPLESDSPFSHTKPFLGVRKDKWLYPRRWRAVMVFELGGTSGGIRIPPLPRPQRIMELMQCVVHLISQRISSDSPRVAWLRLSLWPLLIFLNLLPGAFFNGSWGHPPKPIPVPFFFLQSAVERNGTFQGQGRRMHKNPAELFLD